MVVGRIGSYHGNKINIDSWGGIVLRRILTFIAVLAVPLSLITVSALPASADDSTPTLSPTHGTPGTKVTASATDWTGCSSMSVSGWGTTLGTAAINSAGAFSLPFTVPSNAPAGAAQLMFSPICTHSTYAPFLTFTVDPPGAGISVPDAPSNLTVTPVDPHDIRLDWQDNSSDETGFEINNGVVSRTGGANSTTYTWGGLAPGTYMCFRIRAYNGAGDSAWDPGVSPWYVCATTPKPAGASPPAAPSNLTVTPVDPHDIRLDWQDNSSDETGFEINNGVVSRTGGANSTTYTWGGLAPGTYMCFRIRAYNGAGDSAWDPGVSPWYVCTTTPKPAQEVKYYAALGDSYSAGVGDSPPYPNGRLGCGQSAKAYPALLDSDVPTVGKLGFIACNGAVTDDFYTLQLPSLTFLPNVQSVTLTVGGDDLGFRDVVMKCLNSPTDCYTARQDLVNAELNALAGTGNAATPHGRPIHALTKLLADIHTAAPKARIFVLGYPRLFGSDSRYYSIIKVHKKKPGGPPTLGCYLRTIFGIRTEYIRYDDAQWFNQTADRLNGVLASAAAKSGVATFVSVRAAFTTHGDCDSGLSWFTPVNLLPVYDLGGTALHPNQAGQAAYERNLRAAEGV